MVISPPEVSSIPRLSAIDSSIPFMLDTTIFISNDTTLTAGDQAIAPISTTGSVPPEEEKEPAIQIGGDTREVIEVEDEFCIPKRSKTFEAWDDFDEIE